MIAASHRREARHFATNRGSYSTIQTPRWVAIFHDQWCQSWVVLYIFICLVLIVAIILYIYIRRFIYTSLNVCPFDYTAVAGSGKVGLPVINHTSCMTAVTPTDRPKSVRNDRCLIEPFCGVVCVVTLPFWHFYWCRGFIHRTESDLLLFFRLLIVNEIVN